jgi:LysM repeat protein
MKKPTSCFVLIFLLTLLFVGCQGDDGQTAVSNPTTTPAATQTTTETENQPEHTHPDSQFTFHTNDIPALSDTALAPAPNPHTFQGKRPQHNLTTYVVKRGDTPGGIAQKFGIQPETILGGNPQLSQESSLLQAGVELTILPVDGVLHDVQPGETVESIAELYGVPVEDIIAYEPNNLEFPYRLYPDTQILVPGAVRELFVWTPPDLSSVVGKTSWEGAGVRPVIVGTGTFIYPVNSRNYTQYYWVGHRAVDIALPEGSPVYASDTGTVTYAGWNVYGYGNLIVINHGNGYETFYAHLSAINVVPGQIVYQGNVIGATGNTGNSSGPHIHFEVRLYGNQDDPCYYIGGC